MNLLSRIKAYLTRKNDWVHSDTIYALARKHGYQNEAIKRALKTISHTPPFASIHMRADDTRWEHGPGTFYRFHNMTPDELERNRVALKAFDTL